MPSAHGASSALIAIAALSALAPIPAHAQAQPTAQPSVEQLLTDGWQVSGYGVAGDGRSIILFKHADKKYLAQCSVLYDVTRSRRVAVNCYEIH